MSEKQPMMPDDTLDGAEVSKLRTALWATQEELERLRRQNAAMREALGGAEWCLVMLPEAMVEPVERYRNLKRLLASVLSDNAGADFVPVAEVEDWKALACSNIIARMRVRDDVQPLIEALRHYVDNVRYSEALPGARDMSAYFATPDGDTAKQALAYAREKGWCK